MSVNNKKKEFISVLIIFILTSVIGGGCFLYNKFKLVQVYLNGNPICTVKCSNDFSKVQQEVKNNLEKRFGNVVFNDNIDFKNTIGRKNKITDLNTIKTSIIKNTNLKVNAVEMKSDGKSIGILANETEMRSVLDNIKKVYVSQNKDTSLILKNNITYSILNISINKINTVDEIVKIVLDDEKKALIVFEKQTNIVKAVANTPSRSVTKSNIIDIPSKGRITSNFGTRWGKMHNGIDIGASMGADILSVMDGYVCYANWADGYGNLIEIDHGNGVKTLYGHCNNILVKSGDRIKKGDKIGQVGSTGRSTGPHLHFEIRVDGKAQNPLMYLK